MEELIKDINAIPGVDGTCFFASNGELLESSFESPVKEKMMNAGRMLIKLLVSGTSQVQDTSSLSVCYEESILNVRRFKFGSFLIVKHSALTDANLINIMINNAGAFAEPHSVKADNPEKVAPAPEPDTAQTGFDRIASKSQDKSLHHEVTIQSGPLSNILAGMQRALTRLEGPKAQEIFRDALNNWAHNHEPKISNLRFLADLLSNEIKDQEKIDRYRKMILPYLYLCQK